MKKLNFLFEEIRKEITPLFSSKINIKNTQYKGYDMIIFELEKPQLDQTFFPVLRIVQELEINGKKKIGVYLTHNKIKENRWKIEKIVLKHIFFLPFSIY
ncbi:MAG: hypothetical protein WC430_00385 [Patescibacteria group bacterium]